MFVTKPSSGEIARTISEDYSSYPDISNAPKLRHQLQQEDVATDSQSTWLANESKIKTTGSSTASIRTFSPTGTRYNNKKGRGVFSFLKETTDPDIQNDLSTRHVEDKGNIFENAVWNRVPGSQHFVVSDNLKFILNCCMWYISSSLTNNVGKSIMNAFQFPVTLTFVQFGLVAFWCYVIAVFKSSRIRSPTNDILKTITPLALFLIVGHVFSSIAISRVPVSLVHTIKVRLFFSYLSNKIFTKLKLGIGTIVHCIVL